MQRKWDAIYINSIYHAVPEKSRRRRKRGKTKKHQRMLVLFCGALEGTRTPDLLVRSQSLYPAELLPLVCLRVSLTAFVYYHTFPRIASLFFNFFTIILTKALANVNRFLKKYFIFLEEGAKRLLHAEKERKWCLGEGSASGPEAPAWAEGRAEYPAIRPRRFLPDFLRRPDAA